MSRRPKDLGATMMREHGCYPVFLDAQLVDRYYNGFCNDVLPWPLFHYVTSTRVSSGRREKVRRAAVGGVQGVRNAEVRAWTACARGLERGDPFGRGTIPRPRQRCRTTSRVHDYHLMRLPLELRRRDAAASVKQVVPSDPASSRIRDLSDPAVPAGSCWRAYLHADSGWVPRVRLRAALFECAVSRGCDVLETTSA